MDNKTLQIPKECPRCGSSINVASHEEEILVIRYNCDSVYHSQFNDCSNIKECHTSNDCLEMENLNLKLQIKSLEAQLKELQENSIPIKAGKLCNDRNGMPIYKGDAVKHHHSAELFSVFSIDSLHGLHCTNAAGGSFYSPSNLILWTRAEDSLCDQS